MSVACVLPGAYWHAARCRALPEPARDDARLHLLLHPAVGARRAAPRQEAHVPPTTTTTTTTTTTPTTPTTPPSALRPFPSQRRAPPLALGSSGPAVGPATADGQVRGRAGVRAAVGPGALLQPGGERTGVLRHGAVRRPRHRDRYCEKRLVVGTVSTDGGIVSTERRTVRVLRVL